MRARTPVLTALGVVVALVVTAAPQASVATRWTDPQLAGAFIPSSAIRPRVEGIRTLTHEVFGYLPYWRLDSGTVDRLDYDLVSTIAFFGLGIKADGSIDMAWRGTTAYLSGDAEAVTNAAHDRGIRVVPTFQLFDSGSLPKLTAFLNSSTAQRRFISGALSLMAARSADGASLDFEPVPGEFTDRFISFVARFRAAMKARFPKSTLVNATSAGASNVLLAGLAPYVDHLFMMTYNYRWSGSKIAGAIAPLDNTTRTVKRHLSRYLDAVPASKLILGVGWYGYDWPVMSNTPNATVRSSPSAYGGVHSVTYAGARQYLAAHPGVKWMHDTVEGSGFFTYWDSTKRTWRQVYFEDERSAAAKYDYAIARRLAGVGIWVLDNDRGYAEMKAVLRSKFYAPVHSVVLRGTVFHLKLRAGIVRGDAWQRVTNTGTVPETGRLRFIVRDASGRARVTGSRTLTIFPGRTVTLVSPFILGRGAALAAGRYSMAVRFETRGRVFVSSWFRFRMPY